MDFAADGSVWVLGAEATLDARSSDSRRPTLGPRRRWTRASTSSPPRPWRPPSSDGAHGRPVQNALGGKVHAYIANIRGGDGHLGAARWAGRRGPGSGAGVCTGSRSPRPRIAPTSAASPIVCSSTASDPRLTGTLTHDKAGSSATTYCRNQAREGRALSWLDGTLDGPEGDWTVTHLPDVDRPHVAARRPQRPVGPTGGLALHRVEHRRDSHATVWSTGPGCSTKAIPALALWAAGADCRISATCRPGYRRGPSGEGRASSRVGGCW